jgi:hypothetical protein
MNIVAGQNTVNVQLHRLGLVAPSGTASDLQPCIDQVYGEGGGLVLIPPGDFPQGGIVTIPDRVQVVGGLLGQTIIRNTDPYIWFILQGNRPRLSGISLISSVPVGDYPVYGHQGIKPMNVTDFRVDHVHLSGFSETAIQPQGDNIRGLIDHVEIHTPRVLDEGYGVGVLGGDVWHQDMQLGTENAVFIEDSLFVGCRHAVAANMGAHYVFRHNIARQGVVAAPVDAHGVGWGSTEGTRAVEVYENILEDPIHDPNLPYDTEAAMGIRGGDGVIFSNTIRGYTYAVILLVELAKSSMTYPVKDQIRELYIWNNQHDGSGSEIVVDWTTKQLGFLQEGRDFFHYARPGYVPYQYPHPLTLESAW